MSLIKLLLKPEFKKTFAMDQVYIGIIDANQQTNELKTECLGLKAGKVQHLKHPEIKKLSDNKDHVSFFMDDIKDQIQFKEILTARLKFDFKLNLLTNTVKFINTDNSIEIQILESKF